MAEEQYNSPLTNALMSSLSNEEESLQETPGEGEGVDGGPQQQLPSKATSTQLQLQQAPEQSPITPIVQQAYQREKGKFSASARGKRSLTPYNYFESAINSVAPSDPPDLSTAITGSFNKLRTVDQFANLEFLNPSFVPQAVTRKYKDKPSGYIYGLDNDDYYSDDDGTIKTIGKGLARFGLGTAFKVGQGIGFIGGLLDPGNWDSNIISSASETGMSKFFSGLEEDMKQEWLPLYNSASDRNRGFWWRAFNDLDFWADDVSDGFAFMASAWVPGLALSKLGLGLRATRALSRFRVGASAAEATIAGTGEAANYLANANRLFATNIDKFNAWALATASEAMFEASEVKKNVYDNLTMDPVTGGVRMNPNTGLPYTDSEKKLLAGTAAQNTFILNSALLAGTNAFELSWFGKAFGGAATGTAKGLKPVTAFGEDLAEAAMPTRMINKFLGSRAGAFTKGALGGIAVEGFVEENGQLAIQRVNEHYGTAGVIGNAFNLNQLFKQYIKQTGQALAGEDLEASLNIGIGGLLGVAGGGYKGMSDYKRDKAFTSMAVTAFNNTQNNWLKFGNIYKSEVVDVNDANGNKIKAEKVVFDENNNPVVDAEKLAGVVANYRSTDAAIGEAQIVQNKFHRDLLRDQAFGNFVVAHVNAGIEDTIQDKLQRVRSMTPEDAAKLGFVLDGNIDQAISKYQKLAADIIEQNKVITDDILFDSTPEDTARKSALISLAADQSIYKNLANETSTELQRIKNQLVTSDNTALSDGLVDQLNMLEMRIKSQKEVIKSMEDQGTTELSYEIANQVLRELEAQKEMLVKNNEEGVKELKSDKNGFYQYEKADKNRPEVMSIYNRKARLQGEIQNQIRSSILEYGKYADTIDGKPNFLKNLRAKFLQLAEQQRKEEAANKTEPIEAEKVKTETEEKTAAAEKFTVKFTTPDGIEKERTFTVGASYNSNGSTIKIYKYDPETNLVSFQVDDEGVIEIDAEELAAIADEEGWRIIKETKVEEEAKPKKRKVQVTETPDDILSDISVDPDPKSPTFSEDEIDYKKKKSSPKFEQVGLFKTFGSHYVTDRDGTEKINTEAGADRFFLFTSKFDTSGGDYVFKVVTKDNDEFDIREEKYNKDDMKVIVMKKIKSPNGDVAYQYVDVNNEPISDEEANKKNIIYRSLVNRNNLTVDRIKKDYNVNETTPDSVIQEQIDDFKNWQLGAEDYIKEGRGDIYLDIIGNSPGKQAVQYTKSIGKNNEPEIAMAPLAGRIIPEDPDWSALKSISDPKKSIALRVSTRDGVIAQGIKAGRAVMQEYSYSSVTKEPIWGKKLIRVFNRQLNEDEKELVIESLARMSELFNRGPKSKNPLSPAESAEYTLILNYLKGVLNWGVPREGEKPTPNRFFIKNGLRRGDIVVPFTRDEIIKNKEKLLEGVYHNVNNKMLWGKNDKTFQPIKFIGGKATVNGKEYETYEEYLLHERKDGTTPPVYTSLPKFDSKTPQRTNVYLMWRDPVYEELAPIGLSKDREYAPQKPEPKTKKPQNNSQINKAIDDFINMKTKIIEVGDKTFEFRKSKKRKNAVFLLVRDTDTGKSWKPIPFKSAKDVVASSYKLRGIIYKASGYNPNQKVSATPATKKGKRVATAPKGKEVKLAMIEEAVMNGSITFMTRNTDYHDKFYKGDGVYKTESGGFVNITHLGKISRKEDRIWGKNINMSKTELAKMLGYSGWKDMSSVAKWSDERIVKGNGAVHLYNVTPTEEGAEEETTEAPAAPGAPMTLAQRRAAARATAAGTVAEEETIEEGTGEIFEVTAVDPETNQEVAFDFEIGATYQDESGEYRAKILEFIEGETEEENKITFQVGKKVRTANPEYLAVRANQFGWTKMEPGTVITTEKPAAKPAPKAGSFAARRAAAQAGQKAKEQAPVKAEKAVVSTTPTKKAIANIDDAVDYAFQKGNKLVGQIYERNPKGELVLAYEAAVDIPGGSIIVAKNNLRKALADQISQQQSKQDYSNESPFRLQLSEDVQQTEDFKRLDEFLKKKLPIFSSKRMADIIAGKAWGMFQNRTLYIYENAEIGTGFHEAFEGVWAAFLTDEERQQIGNEFRSRTGTFTNPFTEEGPKEYKDASDYDVREMLAEEFRKYVLDNNADLLPNSTLIGRFFKKLWDLIKGLFNMNKKDKAEMNSLINNVFKNIVTGRYRNIEPIRELSSLAPEYRKVGTLSRMDTQQVLDGLNYFFFRNLYASGNNINSILGGLTKKESNKLLNNVYAKSYKETVDTVGRFHPRVKAQIEAYADDLYTLFKKNIERYGVLFKDIEVNENDVTDTLGIRDSMTIDSRKLTSTNVNLLLASMPEITFSNGRETFVLNEFQLPKLINQNKVHIILKNELANIAPIVTEDGERRNVLDQMFEKLDEKYKTESGAYKEGFGWIASLKRRLKYLSADGRKVDPSTLSAEDINLRISFIKAFNNIKFLPQKLVMGEDGNLYNFDPLVNTNLDRVQQIWSNQLKLSIQDKSNKIIRIDAQGEMVFDRSTRQFKKLVALASNRRMFGLAEALEVLESLGITFSGTESQLLEYEQPITENALQILDLIRKQDGKQDVNSVAEIYGTQKIGGRINKLLSIEARFTSEDNMLTYLNADGEQQYAVGLPSLFSNMINILNTVKNQKELIMTAPWLGYINDEGDVVLNAYQTNSELLKKGGILFDQKGNRRQGTANETAEITYQVISGISLSESEGSVTAKLQLSDRVANKVHFLMNNTVFSNINSDKSTEFGLGLPNSKGLVTTQDIRNLLALREEDVDSEAEGMIYNAVEKSIINKYVAQLEDEMAAALVQSNDPVYIQYYQNKVLDLAHFKNILSPKLIDKFKTEVLSEKPKDKKYKGEDAHIQFIEKNNRAITSDIFKYVNDKMDQTLSFLEDMDVIEFVEDVPAPGYLTDAIDNEALADFLKLSDQERKNRTAVYKRVERIFFTEGDMRSLAGYLAINEEILLTEQHKLIYGHPAMYNQLAKRANGATSTKETIVDDTDIVAWMDSNMVRNDGKSRADDIHQTTRTIVYKDPIAISLYYQDIAEGIYAEMIDSGMSEREASRKTGAWFNENNKFGGFVKDSKGRFTGAMKTYINLNEPDGIGWVMPDGLRDLLFTSNKLTPDQERQWDYEIAYEKVARSKKPTSDPAYKKYTKEELKAAQAIVAKGDPGYVFQVLKPQYFGYGMTEGITHPVFLKHAIQPKFYRHLEGSQYEPLYVAAQNGQVDIIGFESGMKVGAMTMDNGDMVPFYDLDGKANVRVSKTKNTFILPKELPSLDIYSKFYGIQVEVHAKPKNSVVRGTQVTKVIMANLFENGKPIKNNKELANLIKSYNDTLVALTKVNKEGLLKELGLTRQSNGSYKSTNLASLIIALRREAVSRDLPDNIILAIDALQNQDGTQDIKYPFDTIITREKIDNILNSIVDSRVISAKVFGKSSPQVPNTGYEVDPRNYVYLKNGAYIPVSKKALASMSKEEKDSIKLTSNNLKFYTKKNGVIQAMEVYISWPFAEVTPEELGLKLKDGVYEIPKGGIKGIDSNLYKAIAYRIPTSGPNMIENIVIKGFTPAANGDMIVVPTEIVGKAGSDFDIDKLFMYLNKYSVELVGKEYSGKEFTDFMIEDLTSRGFRKKDAQAMLKQFTPAELKKINQATYPERGKIIKGAAYSLAEVVDMDSFDVAEDIKASLTKYNAQYKGSKRLMYITPNSNTKAGLENKLVDIMQQIMSRPEYYAQLVTPNATENLKQLATDIKKAKIEAGTAREEDEDSYTFLRTFIGSSVIRERYLTAKRMVGIAALHTTLHTMAQVSGLKINPEFSTKRIHYLMPKNLERKKGAYGKYQDTKNIDIKLSHYPADEQGFYKIGYRTDTLGTMISDMFGESLSGFVDGAKDPFVFDLNLSMESAGTWFYLQHLGVPAQEIAYLFAQPIMDKFFAKQSKTRALFKRANNQTLFNEELFWNIVSPYYEKVFGVNIESEIDDAFENGGVLAANPVKQGAVKKLMDLNEEYDKLSLKDLKSNVAAGEKADAAFQIVALMNYLEYEAQARLLGGFMQAITYDTASTKNMQENMLQLLRWKKSENQDFIANPEAILENTFLGEMKEQKEDVPVMFRNFFISLRPEIQELFAPLEERISNPEYFGSKEDTVNLLNRYQNFILAYILHTTEYKNRNGEPEMLNILYEDFFKGDNTIPKQLQDLKDSRDSRIADNLIIKELLPSLTEDINKTDSMSLFRNRIDTFETNKIVDALENLKSYAEDTADEDLLDFVENLAKFNIIQSGFQASYTDYKKVLSINTYTELVKKIFDIYETNFEDKGVRIDVNDVWRSFHQNNWKNRSIVPKASKSSEITNTGNIYIKPGSRDSMYDYLIKYVKKKGISKIRMKRLEKEDRGFEAFEPVMFKFTGASAKDNRMVYIPIPRMGNGAKMLEIYGDPDAESIIPSNNSTTARFGGKKEEGVTNFGRNQFSVRQMRDSEKEYEDIEEIGPAPKIKKGKIGFKLTIDKKVKDQGKASLANRFIGYGAPGTSTAQYEQDARRQGIAVNYEGEYDEKTIAFVSVNGNNRASEKAIDNTIENAREILEAGGTVIMDSTVDANRPWNKTGEALVQEALGDPTGQTSKGYNYWGKDPEALNKKDPFTC